MYINLTEPQEGTSRPVTTEILYCARCRRVIRPREIAEGHYHFADGEPVCAECFTRLSRRLRPISGIHEPPKPVDLSQLMNEISGEPAGSVEVSEDPQAKEPQETQATRSRSRTGLKVLVAALFFIAGLAAGSVAYLAVRTPPEKAPAAGPAAQAQGDKTGENTVKNPVDNDAARVDRTIQPAGGKR